MKLKAWCTIAALYAAFMVPMTWTIQPDLNVQDIQLFSNADLHGNGYLVAAYDAPKGAMRAGH